ncbi:DNA-binding transcriptional LysR family regulator [Catenuloplanes nepalensis]|uniref:DNA-binding transcriptional LysR family regulator n=1 Tax=Catenuloplanes nepalensis TaxID=587533 RepID=A0ABT9MRP0_9ACTN|nr:LysR family transcriptional regulator [Catenuloplanes nepalensis]MDP9794097.1 DNA-binding transcriptional LysR family regulator [Catenuloplanes nepalensis]
MADLELRHLEYLVAVAETGSITRAARRLMLTQPALSRALRALERTVGVPLLVRGSRATELTPAGSELLKDAYDLLDRSRVALARARGTETVTVTAPACDVVAVAAAGRDFEARHPGVAVNVVPRDWLSTEALRAGAADVAILRDSFDRRGLAVEPIMDEPRMVLLGAGHPLGARERLTVADLRDETFTYWSGMSGAEAAHWTGSDVDGRPRRQSVRIGSVTDVLAAVALGRAVVYAHGSTLPELLPGMQVRPVEDLSASRLEVGTSARDAGPAARRFVEHILRWTAWRA